MMNKKIATMLSLAFIVSAPITILAAGDPVNEIQKLELQAKNKKLTGDIKRSGDTVSPAVTVNETVVDAKKEFDVNKSNIAGNPFTGVTREEDAKYSELNLLTLDEQIMAKKASISRLKADSGSKASSKLTSLDGDFDNEIKKAASKPSKSGKPSKYVKPVEPVVKPVLPVTYPTLPIAKPENKSASIITQDGVTYVSFDDNGNKVTLKEGDKYGNGVIKIDGNQILAGNVKLASINSTSGYKNPDKQSYGTPEPPESKPLFVGSPNTSSSSTSGVSVPPPLPALF